MGLERAGASVVWANDLEAFKHQMYAGQYPDADHEFVLGDIGRVRGADVPDIDIAWSSFPCTDLSLAGQRAGLDGRASSTFFQFTRVLAEMGERKPPVVALENVTALASSRGGDDLAAAVRELNGLGYSVDVLAIDARRFVPQSRPRLFLIAAQNPPQEQELAENPARPDWLRPIFADQSLRTHRAILPSLPDSLSVGFTALAEAIPLSSDLWWSPDRVDTFVASLSDVQAARLETLTRSRTVSYRTAYRRTRKGGPVWEIRPDDISGCLRTARGGSSKQAVVRAGAGSVSVRWMTSREYARLMGAADYKLDGLRDSQIIFGFGDAVCVDVVAWLTENYLLPLGRQQREASQATEASVG